MTEDPTDTPRPAKVPESYRPAVCCRTCPHCLMIKHQDYTEAYCDREHDAPPVFNAREFDQRAKATPHLQDQIDQDEDRVYYARLDWERDHAVDEWGVCELHPDYGRESPASS